MAHSRDCGVQTETYSPKREALVHTASPSPWRPGDRDRPETGPYRSSPFFRFRPVSAVACSHMPHGEVRVARSLWVSTQPAVKHRGPTDLSQETLHVFRSAETQRWPERISFYWMLCGCRGRGFDKPRPGRLCFTRLAWLRFCCVMLMSILTYST